MSDKVNTLIKVFDQLTDAEKQQFRDAIGLRQVEKSLALSHNAGVIEGMKRFKEISESAMVKSITKTQKKMIEEVNALNALFSEQQFIADMVFAGIKANSDPLIRETLTSHSGQLAQVFVNYRTACQWRGDDVSEMAPQIDEIIKLVAAAQNGDTEPIKRYVIAKGGAAYRDTLLKWADGRADLPRRGRKQGTSLQWLMQEWKQFENQNGNSEAHVVRDGLLSQIATRAEPKDEWVRKPNLTKSQEAAFKSLTSKTARTDPSSYRYDLLER